MKEHKNNQKFTQSSTEDRFVHMLDPNLIRANTSQPRRDFDTAAIQKLAESVREYGILQPLTVRAVHDHSGYRYELIAGERRLRAARMLGLRTVPCLVTKASDARSAELALVENMLRENLDMFEQAAAFADLSEKFGLTQEEIAQKMSLSQPAVANKMRLLKLSNEERKEIQKAGLTERHARAFLRIKTKQDRLAAIRYVIKKNLNVVQTEKYISLWLEEQQDIGPSSKNAPDDRNASICANMEKYLERIAAECEWITMQKTAVENKTVILLSFENNAG